MRLTLTVILVAGMLLEISGQELGTVSGNVALSYQDTNPYRELRFGKLVLNETWQVKDFAMGLWIEKGLRFTYSLVEMALREFPSKGYPTEELEVIAVAFITLAGNKG